MKESGIIYTYISIYNKLLCANIHYAYLKQIYSIDFE